MRDASGELTDGLHFLRLKQLLSGQTESLIGCPPLGDIAGDLCERDPLTSVVVDCVDDDTRPETGSVLADLQHLIFEFTTSRSDIEGVIGQTVALCIVCVEEGRMAADNFFWPITHDALSPHIPIGDVARGIEHENCVIRHAVNENAKLSLGFAQLPVDTLKLGRG